MKAAEVSGAGAASETAQFLAGLKFNTAAPVPEKPSAPTSARIERSRLLRAAGLKPAKGRVGPRPYDFRHTFAVTRLVTWYRDGKDAQRLLPHLATYLGHVHIDHTAHYLTMTKELLKEASICFERYALREAPHA
jgi:integrase